MFVKDVDGKLFNLLLAAKIEVQYNKQLKHVVRAHTTGIELYSDLFMGTEQECNQFYEALIRTLEDKFIEV